MNQMADSVPRVYLRHPSYSDLEGFSRLFGLAHNETAAKQLTPFLFDDISDEEKSTRFSNFLIRVITDKTYKQGFILRIAEVGTKMVGVLCCVKIVGECRLVFLMTQESKTVELAQAMVHVFVSAYVATDDLQKLTLTIEPDDEIRKGVAQFLAMHKLQQTDTVPHTLEVWTTATAV